MFLSGQMCPIFLFLRGQKCPTFVFITGRIRPASQCCILISRILLIKTQKLYLEKVASTQAVLGDTKTPQVPAGDTFWLAWINFLGLVTHIIIRDEKIKGICTCFHHIYTIMCLVHQIGLLCMVFSPLFQGTKYMSPLDSGWVSGWVGEWVSECVSECLDPPVHLRRPLKATCLVVNCSYISGNSSRGIYSCIRLFHKSLP